MEQQAVHSLLYSASKYSCICNGSVIAGCYSQENSHSGDSTLSFRRAVLFLSVAAATLFAQSESGRAALDGRVTDASNKVISGAEIAIRQAQTGFERKVTTNGDGEFRALALPVGIYTIEAVSAGFGASRAENIALTVGETKSVNFTLEVASVSTQI